MELNGNNSAEAGGSDSLKYDYIVWFEAENSAGNTDGKLEINKAQEDSVNINI